MRGLARGWDVGEEQVANAPDDAVDLSPASDQPYLDTLAKWRPLMSGDPDGNNQVHVDEEFDD